MLPFLIEAHNILSRAVQIFTVIMTLYALLLLFRNQELGGDFWGTVIIAWLVIALQTIVGVAMGVSGLVPARGVHYLYGVLALLTWPATFAFTRGQTGRRELVIWATTSAFLFGVALRAVSTAQLPPP
jgi:hypothetical protein